VLERLINVPGPDFPVGSQYAYSNTGYVLLALIVHTLVYDAARPVLHKQAWGYFEENDQFQRWDYPLLTAGDGGLFSTLDDLFLWDQALNTECLVPKAALAQAFTSGTTNDDTPVGYGFGWFTNVFPYLTPAEREQLLAVGGADLRHVAHGGGLYHYNYIIRLLDTQHTIVVLTNFAGARGPRIRAHQVAEILFSV
jgi:CubicO group peptidase (beta-lactamase class C family)